MSNHLSRISLTIEQPIYLTLLKLSEQDGVSLSSKVKELLLSAMEDVEDIGLIELASTREKTFSKKKAMSHKQFWNKVRKVA
ncbi:MAG: hypothetical protein V1833_04585 [Elusimicrobiota bacterium]